MWFTSTKDILFANKSYAKSIRINMKNTPCNLNNSIIYLNYKYIYSITRIMSYYAILDRIRDTSLFPKMIHDNMVCIKNSVRVKTSENIHRGIMREIL